jgi:hypothetical protein
MTVWWACEKEGTARAFLADLQERLTKFGLSLHPDKTRLIEFGRYAAERRRRRGQGRPETFDFLGFTHCCGTNQQGKFQVVRLTAKKRMRATLTAIRDKLYQRRHEPVPIVGTWLQRVLNGYFAYHAVPTNLLRLDGFRDEVCRAWRHTLLLTKPAAPAQLGAVQSPHPQVRPAMPGPASVSGGTLLRVTDLRQEPYAICGRENYVAASEQLPWNERAGASRRPHK